MAGHKNFDEHLKLKKGLAQYRADKSKAGRSGSSAGKPRPYAKRNASKAHLFSPVFVGKSFTVTPLKPTKRFHLGAYYEWHIIEPGVGVINGIELTANDIIENFKVIPKK